MSEHHAIWVNAAKPSSLYAGRLRTSERGVQLEGAGPGGSWLVEIGTADILGVGRARGRLRLGGRAWVRVDLRNGGTLLVGTVLGSRALSEIHEAIRSCSPPELSLRDTGSAVSRGRLRTRAVLSRELVRPGWAGHPRNRLAGLRRRRSGSAASRPSS